MVINKIASRHNIFIMAMLWGAMAIFFAGVISAPINEALDITSNNAVTDTAYHYHVSAVITTALSLFAYLVLSYFPLRTIRREGLSSALKMLILFDLIAVAGGSGFTFGIGWFKEIFDALSGKFFDATDIEADSLGIFSQAIWALILLLPLHGLMSLFAENIRKGMLRAFSSNSISEHIEKAFAVESNLKISSDKIGAEQNNLNAIERKLASLKISFEKLSDTEKKSSTGSELQDKIIKKENQIVSIFDKLTKLEEENKRLKDELVKVNNVLKSTPEGKGMVEEVDNILAQCGFQNGKLSELKSAATFRVLVSDNLSDEVKKKFESKPKDVSHHKSEATVNTPQDYDALSNIASSDKTKPNIKEIENKLADSLAKIEILNNEVLTLGEKSKKLQRQLEIANSNNKIRHLEKSLDTLKRHVSIVEDDKNVRNMLKASLEEIGLLKVKTHESAMDAIECLKETKGIPDLIILDIMMPGLNGVEFCTALQKQDKMKKVPIIFCSACEESAISGLDNLDYEAYIQKPVNFSELEKVVLSALRINLNSAVEI